MYFDNVFYILIIYSIFRSIVIVATMERSVFNIDIQL